MAGLISNEEAEARLNSNSSFLSRIIHGELKRKPKPPKASYDEKVKMAAEAITTSAKDVALKYGYTQQSIQRMVEGKENGSDKNKDQTQVNVQFVSDVKDKLTTARITATDLLAESLGLVTKDELASLGVIDRVDVSAKLAKMVEIMTPNGSLKVPQVIVIAAPEIRTMASIDDALDVEFSVVER